MRIYVQVPFTGYEHADRHTRAQQASKFTPPELDAYRFLTDNGSQNTPKLRAYKQDTQDTQDTNGPIPGGHITWIVWQKVPGKCLGDIRNATVYWRLKAIERKCVRDAFKSFRELTTFPLLPGKLETLIIRLLVKSRKWDISPITSVLAT